MTGQPVGAHVQGDDPLAEAEAVGAERIQLFLSNPQGWEKPPPRDDAEELKTSEVGIYVHAPYLINVCSPKPNVRYGSRKILQQTCDAAAEIERVVLRVEGVRAAAVVGRRDAMLDEVPVAFVVAPGADEATLAEAVVAACRDQLADFKVPRAVHLIDALPEATLGKIAKGQLQKLAQELA